MPVSYRLTVLCDPARLVPGEEQRHAIEKLLGEEGIEYQLLASSPADAPQWELTRLPAIKTLNSKLIKALEPWPLDFILRPADAPTPRLLISDMDSTMIEQECIDELAGFIGKKEQVAAITERAMNGELDFAAALKERVALLAGLPESDLEACFRERITFSPGARELVQSFTARGGHAILVSGGFTFFTRRVAATLGFQREAANRLEIQGGMLTGRVLEPILGKEAKVDMLRHICHDLRIKPDAALAIGDGANDLPMLQAAGFGVAYRAKPVVQAASAHRLNHAPLSALLYVL